MDIKDIRIKKQEAENEIKAILNELQKETDVTISSVDIGSQIYISGVKEVNNVIIQMEIY